MRRILVLLVFTIAVVLASTVAEARDQTDWKAVQRLKPGTVIEVVTAKEVINGRLTAVTEMEVRLEARDRSATGLLTLRSVPRSDVLELYKSGKHLERRIPAGQLLLSSVIGAAVGVGIGAAYDSAHPYSDDPGSGKLVFGALGFFVGPAATAIGRSIYSAMHKQKLIYRAPEMPTPLPSNLTEVLDGQIGVGEASLDTPMS